jgi:hypothetical protein
LNELKDLERKERQNIEKMEQYMQKMDQKPADTGKRRTSVADVERTNGGNVAPMSQTKSAGWNQDSTETVDPTGQPRRTTSTMKEREVRSTDYYSSGPWFELIISLLSSESVVLCSK